MNALIIAPRDRINQSLPLSPAAHRSIERCRRSVTPLRANESMSHTSRLAVASRLALAPRIIHSASPSIGTRRRRGRCPIEGSRARGYKPYLTHETHPNLMDTWCCEMFVYDDHATIDKYRRPPGRRARGRGRGRGRPHTTTTTMSSDEAERADAPEETVEEVRGVLSRARDGWMIRDRERRTDEWTDGWMARARSE